MGKKITPGNAIDCFLDKLKYAYKYDYINKPVSWALYQTWKWADKNEKERKGTTDAL